MKPSARNLVVDDGPLRRGLTAEPLLDLSRGIISCLVPLKFRDLGPWAVAHMPIEQTRSARIRLDVGVRDTRVGSQRDYLSKARLNKSPAAMAFTWLNPATDTGISLHSGSSSSVQAVLAEVMPSPS